MSDQTPFLFDPASWSFTDPTAIPARIGEHLVYSGVALGIAAAIAIPIGMLIGHTGRGAFLTATISNSWRALPTFGLLSLLVTLVGVGEVPALAALVVLAIPPILLATYAGIRAVEPAVVDAARGMGLRGAQVLRAVEAPMALPLIMGGLRSAALQVVSTATIAAYVGLGGLGRFLVDGLALGEYDQVLAGAVVVAALSILADLLIAGAQRLLVSPGLAAGTPSGSRASTAPRTTPPQPADAASA